MRVQEQQEFFNAVLAQKRLRIAIGDETQDIATFRMRWLDVGDNSERGGAVSAHAVDDQVGHPRR